MRLQNLKGDPNVDFFTRQELERCGIPVEETDPSESEIHCSLMGRLGDFEIIRRADAYEVRGKVPIEVAEKIFDDPVGDEIWANCFSGGTPPQHVAAWLTPDNQEARPPGPNGPGEQFVTSYLVKSESALRFLVNMIKGYGLQRQPVAA